MGTTKTQYYHLSAEDVFKQLQSSREGLSASEVAKRAVEYGSNTLPKEKPPTWLALLLSQFKGILIYILLVAAGINFGLVCREHNGLTFGLSEQADTYIILLAVLVNVIIGFVQEGRAQKSLQALEKIITLKARVVRDGREQMIDAKELVPGDIIIIAAGDKVPADARLFEVEKLAINEAPLTGESAPEDKVTDELKKDLSLGDQANMIFTGTTITKGQGVAVVVEIGEKTEIGHIAKLLKETKDEETPLQQKLNVFSKNIGLVILGVTILLVIIGYLQGDPFIEIFTVSVAVAVSALPEGLAVAVTVILAVGMRRILGQKALVRKLAAAETLGSTTVICTDKTGTLTEGNMRVTNLITWSKDFDIGHTEKEHRDEKNEELIFALHAGMLNNDARIDNPDDNLEKWVISGNLTERALLSAAIQAGIDYKQERAKYPRLDSVPFDSSIKYMATLHKLSEEQNIVYFKGASEKVLARCQKIRVGNQTEIFDEEKKKKFQEKFIALSGKGLRVIAIAYQKVDREQQKLTDVDLNELVFIGFFGIKDPLRSTSKETVHLCQKAGIKIVMITGDHKLTAQAIAQDLKLPAQEENILEGEDLDKMSDDQLKEIVDKISVYARVSPEHKLRIVQAWFKRGEVVAMTGDGINDSPALKAADIGVALGSGTQVAKETAEMVILDDHFKSIVGAVKEGRGIFDNIKKTVLYLISDSFSEVILVIGTMILGLPLPLTAAQILWINLVNDTLPSLSLTQEPREKEIMDEPPRGRKAKILDKEMKILVAIASGVNGLMNIVLFVCFYKFTGDIVLARTVVFAALGVDSLVYIFSVRSLRHSVLKFNPFSNKYLIGALIISFGFLLAAIYWPFMQQIMKTKSLGLFEWVIVASMSIVVVSLIELVKYVFLRRGNRAVKN
ncbi:HAD-IC family P-type ATPase [Patescibacteria group bacterium]|nr:HAD-IC family P-type ATPase [Patescibacteria group bacterium]